LTKKQTPKKLPPCPVKRCSYSEREEERRHPTVRIATYKSTRASVRREDVRRDFDGWDVNEELGRLRLAIMDLCSSDEWDVASPSVTCIVDLFSNIDESLVREGDLPDAWREAQRPASPGAGGHAPRNAG
jgi:hypothetical protein